MDEHRLGNLSGFTGGSYAYQVYDTDTVAPTITRCGDGGGRMPHIIERYACAMRGRKHGGKEYIQDLEISGSEVSNSITSVQKDSMVIEESDMYRIRRLTERETWRLQNFSDEDFDKAASVNSKTQLYKQSGNSICVNCLVAIFGQMFEGHEDDYKKFANTVQY